MSIPRPTDAPTAATGASSACFDLLLKLVEPDSQRLARLRRSGFEPCLADQLQSALLPSQPMQPEGFLRVGGQQRRGPGADLLGNGSKGLVKGRFIVGRS